MQRYRDREDAGKVLALELLKYKNQPNTVVLALPRGGVPVAYQIAIALHLPLDVFIVRKLGLPLHKELAMGAIAEGNVTVFNRDVIDSSDVSQADIQSVIDEEKAELLRRQKKYRGHANPLELKNKHIILVDDGVATGATMRAAVSALRQMQVGFIIIAVPVSQKDFAASLTEVDEFISPLIPDTLHAVGEWYDDFSQTEDEEVITLLQSSHTY